MKKKQQDSAKVLAGRAGGLVGGKSTSEAKQRASRQNGSLGGAKSGGTGGRNGGRPKGIPISSDHAQKAAAGRAAKLTPERRREIALKAVAAREEKRKRTSI